MSNTRLQLEFSPQASKNSNASWALLAVAVSLFSVLALYAGKVRYENSVKQRELAAMEAEQRSVTRASEPRAVRTDPAELARVQFVRSTSRNLAAPWADLLVALENAPANVALLVVEPSAAKRSVSLTAEAAATADMIDYVEALQKDSHLSNVVLVSHQMQMQAPGTPVRFQLRASWGNTP
jgi:hypothetical protein